jgi:hypothetical protein
MDFIFTVCDSAAKDTCPVWPGYPMSALWSMPDPSAAIGSEADRARAFAAAYETLGRRITLFFALPFSELDRASLQQRMRDIGRE